MSFVFSLFDYLLNISYNHCIISLFCLSVGGWPVLVLSAYLFYEIFFLQINDVIWGNKYRVIFKIGERKCNDPGLFLSYHTADRKRALQKQINFPILDCYLKR